MMKCAIENRPHLRIDILHGHKQPLRGEGLEEVPHRYGAFMRKQGTEHQDNIGRRNLCHQLGEYLKVLGSIRVCPRQINEHLLVILECRNCFLHPPNLRQNENIARHLLPVCLQLQIRAQTQGIGSQNRHLHAL